MDIDVWGLALQAVNVLILIWLLSRVFWRPVAAAIAKRQQAATAIIEDAPCRAGPRRCCIGRGHAGARGDCRGTGRPAGCRATRGRGRDPIRPDRGPRQGRRDPDQGAGQHRKGNRGRTSGQCRTGTRTGAADCLTVAAAIAGSRNSGRFRGPIEGCHCGPAGKGSRDASQGSERGSRGHGQ